MTTTTLASASPPPALDLDARFALLDALMDERLATASVAFEVNTAHIEGADPVPDTTEVIPLTPTLAPAPSPYTTPLADLLHRARVHIETHGWIRGQLRCDNAIRRCPIGAIQIEAAGNHGQTVAAATLLLEAIQRDHPDVDSVPSWNDSQTSPAPVLLCLDRAAQLAHDRGL